MSEFDLGALLQQAQQVKEQIEYMKKGLAEQQVEGSAGAGMVKAIATGDLKIVSVNIDPSVMSEDRDMLQDLVVAAVNNALDKARKLAEEKAAELMPAGMPGGGFPGGFPGL